MQRIVLIVVLLLVALASSYQMFSTNAHYKREVQAKLDELAQAVETQDPAKVKKLLDAGLDDFAHVSIEVRFPIPGQPERHPPPELFGKTEFLAFIDNILYTVNAYHFKASVEDMELSPDKSSAILTLSVNASAHGVSSALGEMSSQFATSGTCHAKALFDPQAKPTLGDLACVVTVGR